ncbi:MAG TPA: PAS domain-containing protein [Terriglobales bacterium]
MKLLANPIFIRMAAVLVVFAIAFVAGIVVIRLLRRRMVEDSTLPDNLGQEDTVYPYTAVIQQLKQQKFELQNEQQLQRRRAKAYENMATAVIANLPCGILFVTPNGLVKQCNNAARQILGFASPLGMSLEALFRDATCVLDSGSSIRVAEAFKSALQQQVRSSFETSYRTAGADERSLRVTLIPLTAAPGESAGMAAVIADESASADSRRARIMHSEISAEMALELRNSLGIIRDCARQLAVSAPSHVPAHFAEDICAQAERLDKVVGGFLAGKAAAASAAGA